MFFCSLIGFLIDNSEIINANLVRFFIDIILIISIIFILLFFPIVKKIPIQEITIAFQNLVKGKYDTRLSSHGINGELLDFIKIFNKVASYLEDKNNNKFKEKNNLNNIKSNFIKTKVFNEKSEHKIKLNSFKLSKITDSTPIYPLDMKSFNKKNNVCKDISNKIVVNYENYTKNNNDKNFHKAINMQDINTLFNDYIIARKGLNLDEINFNAFESKIKETCKTLFYNYKCRSINFDVVIENKDVAIRPKIIR